ncbi:MAG: hypothetical protein HY062_12405 [Bacteroidetes bacterium]|nr:hypothetical protein [Bacteroidota bacterium]
MRFFKKSVFGLFLLSVIVSCKKETSWDIDAAVPIARSHLNISNFFGDTIFKSDPNGLLHIAFSKDLLNYTMDSLVKLPDTTVSIGYTVPFSTSLSPGVQIFSNALSNDKEITFDVSNGVELNKAVVKKGLLKIDYINTYAQPLKFNYIINSATLWGTQLSIEQVVAGSSTLSKTYALDGYDINLTGLSHTKVNTLVQTYTISTDPSGVADQLQPGQGLTIKLSFIDIVPEYIQGYFGQQNLSFGPDSTSFGFLSNFSTSNLLLSQSAINFRIINEFGIEMSSSINSMRSIKTSPNHNVVTLNAGNLLQSINVGRANKTNNPSNPVFPWFKQININSSNSNLNPFLENLPNYLGYSVHAVINPLGNISAGNDFAYYGRGLKVIADVDIPLALSADYFSLVNYSKVDLTQLKELNNVNTCQIIVQTRNNYPFKAQIQGYMLNDQNQIIDSLFIPGQNIIESAITDANNVVLNYVDSKLESDFNKDKIDHLAQCKQIKFVSYLYLPNQPTPIKINEDSYLDLVVNAFVNYNVKSR